MTAISKICSKCTQDKPLSSFYKRGDNGKYRSECKECNKKEAASKWIENTEHREKTKKRQKEWQVMRDYGVTIDEYNTILGDGCFVCGTDEDLVLDHCHITGEVRGCLCRKHNTALGLLGDNIEQINKLQEYMLRFGE